MAVGITILSGARRGQEVAIEQPEFRAGDDPACEIFFDPQQEPAVRGRQALFRLGDDGWYVKSAGGGPLLVNGQQIEASTRLRSGDAVRLSPGGPELSFKLLARLPAGAKATAIGTPDMHDLESAPPRRSFDWGLPVAIGVGALVGAIVLYFLLRQPAPSVARQDVSASQRAIDAVPQPAPQAAAKTSVAEPADAPPPGAALQETASDMAADDDEETAAAAPPAAPKDSSDDAVVLLLVEEPKSGSAWPFGSASAIAERTLLTSATVSTGLADFRDKGWRLWATNQRLGLKVPINDLRVHAAFATAQGEPEKQVYVDFGLLTLADPWPKQLSLAGADELDEVDRGMPLTLRGYPYENEPVDRFQTFLPEPHPGKIFVITSLPPSPGGPRLMHVRAELPGKMYGAPILNDAGHVLGVFAETAVPSPDQPNLHIQYAPVIAADHIARWLTDHDEQWWVPPAVGQTNKPDASARPAP